MYGEWWQGKPLDGHGDSIKAEWRHFVLRKTTCDDIRGKLVDQNDMPSSYGMQEVVLAIEGKPGLALPHATCRIVTL